ncbi:MAG: AAA family ATPase, partial [Synergistaceae bacterium]|nr:AAA family ATPase [Synergistaceae bacterium]
MGKLPVGIQTFEKIRNEGYLYVDKTKYLVDLIDSGTVYFLSRPRRFGKSLTISTFEALFTGRRELFEGLCAEEFFDRPGYKSHPVIRLDMSQAVTNRGLEDLLSSMTLQVIKSARHHAIELSELALKNPSTALSELIELAAEKEKKTVVVLVDEYDKPILDNM